MDWIGLLDITLTLKKCGVEVMVGGGRLLYSVVLSVLGTQIAKMARFLVWGRSIWLDVYWGP